MLQRPPSPVSPGGLLEDDGPPLAAEADAQQAAAPRQRQPGITSSFGANSSTAARHDQERDELQRRLMAIHDRIADAAQLQGRDAVEFFDNVSRKDDNKQQMKGRCKACGKAISSTASVRFIEHISKCASMPNQIQRAFQRLRADAGSKAAAKRHADAMSHQEAEVWAKRHAAQQQQLDHKQPGIKASLQGAEAAWADKCIAEFFYANAIPFSVASSESSGLYRRMVAAIKATPASYKPPATNKLGNELLDKCYDEMWRKLAERDPDGSLGFKYGSTYVTDGWDSCDNHSLINSAFITNNDGGIFWRSVDTAGKVKCAEYTAQQMIADIYSFGPTKVVMVCTDTCAVMQKAWDIVMYEFPWISVMPCQPHVISLLLKDIGKTTEVNLPALASARARTCRAVSMPSNVRAHAVQ